MEAGERKVKTQEQVMELVQIIEEASKLQQQHAEAVAVLTERLLEVKDTDAKVGGLNRLCVCVWTD